MKRLSISESARTGWFTSRDKEIQAKGFTNVKLKEGGKITRTDVQKWAKQNGYHLQNHPKMEGVMQIIRINQQVAA